MILEVTQCEKCPFAVFSHESESREYIMCGALNKEVDVTEENLPTNCPLTTSPITVKLKEQ